MMSSIGNHRTPCLVMLRGLYPTLTVAECRVADHILANPVQVTHSTITEVATASEVGVGTIGRLCTKLGYSGFPELKMALAAELSGIPLDAPSSLSLNDSPAILLEKVIGFGTQNLNETAALVSIAELENAADAVLHARRVEVYVSNPLSVSVAQLLHHRLLLLGIPCSVVTSAQQQVLSAGLLTQFDVAVGISQSGETETVIGALGTALAAGAMTVCITNTPSSPITRVSKVRLLAAARKTGTAIDDAISYVGMIAILEVLYAFVASRRESPASERTPAKRVVAAPLVHRTSGDRDGAQLRRELRVAVPNLPITLDPQRELSKRAARVLPLIYESLIFRGRAGTNELLPRLAHSWSRVDERTLDVFLRRDIVWQDNTPFSAEDVVFTFKRILSRNSELEASSDAIWPLESVTQLADDCIRFVAKIADSHLEARLASHVDAFIVPAHVSPDDDANEATTNTIGTGPYRLREWIPEQQMRLVAHQRYYGGQPAAQQLILHNLPDQEARVAALLNHDVDFITDVPPNHVQEIEASRTNIVVPSSLTTDMYVLLFNMQAPPVDKLEIRQALSMAIDRAALIEKVWRGYAVHPRGFQFPDEFTYDASRALTVFDPEQAMFLLQRGGYSGEPLLFAIASPDYYPLNRLYAEAVVEMWRSIGVNAHIHFYEVNKPNWPSRTSPDLHVHNMSISTLGDPERYLVGFWGNLDGALHRLRWWSPEASKPYLSLVGQLLEATDGAERTHIYTAMRDELERVMPGTPLVMPEPIYAMSRLIDFKPVDFHGLNFRPSGLRIRDGDPTLVGAG